MNWGEADWIEVEPGVFSGIAEGVVLEARVDEEWVTIEGRRYATQRADPRKFAAEARAGLAAARDGVIAPMPGKVIRILVKVGDDVEAGQGIAVVEAMKMQNELKAAHAGRVISIHAAENDVVNAGFVLAVIE